MRLYIQPMNRPFVMCQMVALDEPFITDLAFKPLAGVSTDMRLQVVSLRKAFIAEAALIRLFASVNPHVDQKVVRPLEA